MNAIVAICHFCEAHGPQPLFCTFKSEDDAEIKNPSQCEVKCNGCASVGADKIMISRDDGIVYCSRESIPNKAVSEYLKQAAVRSITCETYTNNGGLVYFSETSRCILSFTFQLKDTHARGLKRWFSIITLSSDRSVLMHLLPMLKENLKTISSELQSLCEHVYNEEQSVCSQRSLRLSSGQYNFGESRSLQQLTGDCDIYEKLHAKFTMILKCGALTYQEHLYSTVDLFKRLQIKDDPDIFNRLICGVPKNGMSLRKLEGLLTKDVFKIVIYCTLIGTQVVINTTHTEPEKVKKTLSFLLPIMDEDKIITYCGKFSPCFLEESDSGKWSYKWNGTFKEGPTLMRKIEKLMDNPELNDLNVHRRIKYFQLEWIIIAKNVKSAVKVSSAKSKSANELLKTFGVSHEDMLLVAFWYNNFI